MSLRSNKYRDEDPDLGCMGGGERKCIEDIIDLLFFFVLGFIRDIVAEVGDFEHLVVFVNCLGPLVSGYSFCECYMNGPCKSLYSFSTSLKIGIFC